jgi:hypothetical protein
MACELLLERREKGPVAYFKQLSLYSPEVAEENSEKVKSFEGIQGGVLGEIITGCLSNTYQCFTSRTKLFAAK